MICAWCCTWSTAAATTPPSPGGLLPLARGHGHAPQLVQHTLEDDEEALAAGVAPVVHSYWEHKITNDGENIGICHNCKYPVSWFWERANYCPNCGAKMDRGAEDENLHPWV